MATAEFDRDRWPAELRALADAQDDATEAYLDHMDDRQLLSEFNAACERFRAAHRAWLREHPDRIPGLIAHRRRKQRRSRSYRRYESDERIRAAERAEIEELWTLHQEVLYGQAAAPGDEPSRPEQVEAPRFTVEVATVHAGYQTTAFGVFDTVEEADQLATQWRQTAKADGLTDLYFSVRQIHDVSNYASWVDPERRRAQQERAARDLAAHRRRLLLSFHDDEAIKELAPQLIADAVAQTGRFEVLSPAEAVDSYRRAAVAAGRLIGKSLTTSEARSSEGSLLTMVVKTTIDLAAYRSTHGRSPSGPGSWTLRNTDTGEEITRAGTWGSVRVAVPAGDWTLLP